MSFGKLRNHMVIKYPYLQSGGFKEGFKNKYTVKLATENLLLFKSITDKYDLKYWLSFGTLLGLYRDGLLISHDCDIDISSKDQDCGKFIEADQELFDNGFEPVRLDKNYPLISWGRKGQYIDLYGYIKINEKEWRICSYKIEDAQINNFSKINYKGYAFDVPNDPEHYILEHYGGDWKTPKPGCPAKGN